MPMNCTWLEHSAHMRPITRSKAASLRMGGKSLEVLEVVASGSRLDSLPGPLRMEWVFSRSMEKRHICSLFSLLLCVFLACSYS